jgi:hypothetical protein
MAPFTKPALVGIKNDGNPSSGAFNSFSIYETPASFGVGGYWTLSRAMQAQMGLWKAHYGHMVAYQDAVENRDIEDTWITTRPCIMPSIFATEISTVSWTDTDIQETMYTSLGAHAVDANDDPNTSLTATPCNMAIQWGSKRYTHQIHETVENVLAFHDTNPPVVEYVEHEIIPGGYYRIGYPSYFLSGRTVPPDDSWNLADFTIPTNGYIIWDVQPALFEPEIRASYVYKLSTTNVHNTFALVTEQEARILGGQIYDSIYPNLPWADEFFGIGQGGQPKHPPYYTDSELGTQPINNGAGSFLRIAPSSSGNGLVNAPVKGTQHSSANDVGIVDIGPYHDVRPRAWDHTDSEFAGYVPYHPDLVSSQGNVDYLEEYAREPDDRFDGLYFTYKIKVANVSRAWNAYVRNVKIDEDPSFVPLKTAELKHYAWQDPVTGEFRTDGLNYCSAMTPVEIPNWLSPDVIGTPEITGFDWSNYTWPRLTITLPDGTFFLEDGSAAPIYPTFYGAYVYDMHLKKWGRYDEAYKRLLDYSAINTYMPNEQSYKRVGIFGGSLNAAGKIRLFDEKPATSWVKYGKIGYYRQGMTSMEEVRIHHRVGATGEVLIESSIEGKLIDPTLNLSSEFSASSMWTHRGSYSAKWHNVTVSGHFDLTYFEFRGIISGRR